MYVIKRNNERELVSFDTILERLETLAEGLDKDFVDCVEVAKKVVDGLYDGVSTEKLDQLASETSASLGSVHPDYLKLASRLSISNLHKITDDDIYLVAKKLYSYRKNGEDAPIITKELYDVIKAHQKFLNGLLNHRNDYFYDYFGFKTLEKSYLSKIDGKIVERPQHMLMRVALAINNYTVDRDLVKTYEYLSNHKYTHASPTLFQAGTPLGQLASCFLLQLQEDSMNGIFDTLKECANISKHAGGIGLNIHNLRAKGSYIKGTGGTSNGLVPTLRIFNETARMADQCFTGETEILTKTGVKKISDIVHNDEVLNENGEFVQVGRTMSKSTDEELICINLKNSDQNVRVTKTHNILRIKNQDKSLGFNAIKSELSKNLLSKEWVEAQELEKGDFLIFPIPKYTDPTPTLGDDDYHMYGLMLVDGYITKDDMQCGITMCKSELLHIVKRYLTIRGIKYYEYKNNNCSTIKWQNSPNFYLNHSMLYDAENNKQVQSFALHAELEKSLQLVKGIVEAGGYVGTGKSSEILLEMNSKNVTDSIRYILLRAGILSSEDRRDRVGEKNELRPNEFVETEKESIALCIPKTETISRLLGIRKGKNFNHFCYEGYLYSRISSISNEEKTSNKVQVYDIEVHGDMHSYTLNNLGIVHNGGGRRKGAFAVYLEPWHADIFEFLELRKNHGKEEMRARDLFTALWIPNLFMKRVEENSMWTLMCPNESKSLSDVYGEEFEVLYTKYETEGKFIRQVKARDLWSNIINSQIETGTPYMLYKDACNQKSNQQNLGTIKSSNLCVAPETKILTDEGYKEIQTLEGKKVKVWNGKQWSETVVNKTGENKKLIKIVTDCGQELECTEYHKFYVKNNYHKKAIIKRVHELQVGDKLEKFDLPKVDVDSFELDKQYYVNGLYTADGCFTSNKNPHRVYLYGGKQILEEHLPTPKCKYSQPKQDRTYLEYSDLMPKYWIPETDRIDCFLSWFAGYLDGDGCVLDNNGNKTLQIVSTNSDLFSLLQLRLQEIGVNSKFKVFRKAGQRKLPNHRGDKELSYYYCKKLYRFTINGVNTQKLYELGIPLKRLSLSYHKGNRVAEQHLKISKIIDNGRFDDTYCFAEPLENKGIFNGILTGNCTEIIEYTDPNETAVCNLASINLKSFVNTETLTFNFSELGEVTEHVTKMLNKVIDVNNYPSDKTSSSNKRHRPIGIGVQGLANVFMLLRIPFESEEAKNLNKLIFETIYYYALKKSMELAISPEGRYSTFENSPASKGILQFDLWGVQPSDMYDWEDLKKRIKIHGLRNSLLLAPMPTASTSQILNNIESFEPLTSNIYTRRTLSGEFMIVNEYLIRDLIRLGLWNNKMKQTLIQNNGSIQHIDSIPVELKELYKTTWEISQKAIIDMSADRGAFICQSQSLNIHMKNPNYAKLTSMHFYGWKAGLKTGMYYLRSNAATEAIKFTVDKEVVNSQVTCSLDNPDECISCSG